MAIMPMIKFSPPFGQLLKEVWFTDKAKTPTFCQPVVSWTVFFLLSFFISCTTSCAWVVLMQKIVSRLDSKSFIKAVKVVSSSNSI